MGKKWEEVEVLNLRVKDYDEKVYKQLIDEVAGFVYSEICQLHKNSLADSSDFEDQLLERTGTDA